MSAVMYRWFLESAIELVPLSLRALFAPWRRGDRAAFPSALVPMAFLPVLWIWFLIQWAGLLLDEILFPDYREVEIREPVFVLGVPRTGTTALHRVLARDEQFTTFRTWECFFAPSITIRKLVQGVGRADAAVGRPLARSLRFLEGWLEQRMGAVHDTRLEDAEEDYLSLLPILRSFILIVPFPSGERIWRMGLFDRDVPEPERRRILGFYRGCLQRHLYVHGPDRRLLSKNAAFASWAGSLRREFPDARIIACMRDPRAALPSQLSSLQVGLEVFGSDVREGDWRDRIIERLEYGYVHLWEEMHRLPEGRGSFVAMEDLGGRTSDTVRRIYRELSIPLTAQFEAALEEATQQARGFRSSHRYSLEDYGLSESDVHRRFKSVYERYESLGPGAGAATS